LIRNVYIRKADFACGEVSFSDLAIHPRVSISIGGKVRNWRLELWIR
jgi:hypothetical protein